MDRSIELATYHALGVANKLLPTYRKAIAAFPSLGNDFMLSLLRPRVAEVLGHRMFLDSLDTLRLSANGIYEPLETEFIGRLVKEGDVVVDIGAQIGYYTLILAKLVGKDGRVFAFEPAPQNFALLRRNVAMNDYHNVVAVQKAISNTTGQVRLYLSTEDMGDHRIYDSGDRRKSIEIEAIRLDDYFESYLGSISFIKMDIQGAELGAIQGMALLLQGNANVNILTEFWPYGLERFGFEPEDYLGLLAGQGFHLYELKEATNKIEPTSIGDLLRTYTPEKRNYTNLAALRFQL